MSQTQSYQVRGMTCGHCVGAVTGELEALDGVTSVTPVQRNRHGMRCARR